MRQEYLGWVSYSEWARVNLGTDFPDPPSYGCKDVSCISSRNESDIEWCKHDLDRLLKSAEIHWKEEVKMLRRR